VGDGFWTVLLVVFVARLMLFVAEAAPADVRPELVRKARLWYRSTLYAVAAFTLLALFAIAMARWG